MPTQNTNLQRSLAPRPLFERPLSGSRVPHDLLLVPTAPARPASTARGRSAQQISPAAARVSAWVGLALALALPVLLWSHDIGVVASTFHLGLGYLLTGWGAYALILGGLVLLAAVMVRPGPAEDHARRRARVTWGVSLYLLGMLLASQVAAFLG